MVKWDQQESKLMNSMQVKHRRPTDKKCGLRAGLEPVARSKWMIHQLLNRFVSWTEASRCWGLYRERTKRLQFMREEAGEDTGVENTFWRGWIDTLRLLTTIFSYIYLSYPSLRLCGRTLTPPTPHHTPKNEKRNERLKSSTVQDWTGWRERERDEYLYNYIKNSTTLHVLYPRLFNVLKKHGKRSSELTEELLQPIRRLKFTLKCWENALPKLKGVVYIYFV